MEEGGAVGGGFFAPSGGSGGGIMINKTSNNKIGAIGAIGGASGGGSGSCSCPSSVNSALETVRYSQCPICLTKFDLLRVPVGLKCGHTLCLNCVRVLVPGSFAGGDIHGSETNINGGGDGSNGAGGGGIGLSTVDKLSGNVGIVNVPLLAYLEYPVEHLLGPGGIRVSPDCLAAIWRLLDVAVLMKSHTVSRAIHRKILALLTGLSPTGQLKVLKSARAIGERALVELTSSCSNLSHYHAQQQLWAAIRARACQFMGPAMQEEALKLVLLALEDGSALSRKVLVMFVVQRLAPQFPQASKTSVGHIVQLLYRASTFDVSKRPGNSSLMTLRPEYRNYEALRREHDTQIMRIGFEAGIRFTPEQWSSLLYGDSSHKPLMQSIIDKLQAPQTFTDLLKEFLVSVQRLDEPESQFLLSIYPHFHNLNSVDIVLSNNDGTSLPDWSYVEQVIDSVHKVLVGLVSFNKPKTSSRRKFQDNHHNVAVRMMQNVSLH